MTWALQIAAALLTLLATSTAMASPVPAYGNLRLAPESKSA